MTAEGVRLIVREREPRDLDALEVIAAEVQANDGYPGKRPRDLRSFLVADDALGAWIAELDGQVVGHVALHASSLPVVMDRARQALGASADDELAVVARLIVDPRKRRIGAGRALLEYAVGAAQHRRRHAILDVVTRYEAAIALYESAGWMNAGEVEMRFADDTILQSYVYVAPTPLRRTHAPPSNEAAGTDLLSTEG